MRNEFDANRTLQPVPLAMRLQGAGWQVGAHALQPVKPRATRQAPVPVKPAGWLARIFAS